MSAERCYPGYMYSTSHRCGHVQMRYRQSKHHLLKKDKATININHYLAIYITLYLSKKAIRRPPLSRQTIPLIIRYGERKLKERQN
jgi:hypothetical protein